MTQWLLQQNHSSSLAIEKTCVLQDVNQQNRIIRCQQQDLFSNSIQLLLKDGCEVKKIALSWQEHMTFILLDNFSLQSIRFQDKVIAYSTEMEAESKLQQLHANFMIMSELFSNLFKELLKEFSAKPTPVTAIAEKAIAVG
jgi:recombination associated protein RdgC